MRIGQTSIIVYLSKLIGSAIGFLATLYFARLLGAQVLGLYALVMAIVGWLNMAGQLGIGNAMIKRISENKERGAYLAAAIVWKVLLLLVIAVGLLLSKSAVEGYLGEFDQYSEVSVVWFLTCILVVRLFQGTVFHTLMGERKVHIPGLLRPLSVGSKSLIQILLVVAGYSLVGILAGWIAGGVLVGVVAIYWTTVRPTSPAKQHFVSLFDYAKFSWLGRLESRVYNNVDILLLGVFVPSSLVGIYSVAWSIAKFIEMFGSAISQAVFPEISYNSAQETDQSITGLIEDALTYTGLMAIPGLVGGAILAKQLLRLYGPEFTQGSTVLVLLVLSVLLYSYQNQLVNALNGIDRPEIAFRISAIFIVLNAVLNVVLIWQFGIVGAAVATAVSAGVGLVLAYYALRQLVEFRIPIREPSRQIVAAVIMGGIVGTTLETIERTDIINYNAIIVFLLVGVGAGVYFAVLFTLSTKFRETVNRNLPVDVPYLL